jgi:membrane protein DedA with SNARE-associated domain
MKIFDPFINWYMSSLETGGYWLVALLMAMESSIIPLPSEVVMPPAAHVAVTTGSMTLTGLVIAGTLGSWAGATVMYVAARFLGRPLLERYGRYVLIPPHKIVAAETWSRQFGTMGVFVARLLPVIRHLIGIPAGIVRLNYLWYSAATLIGSAIWCTVLVWVGVKAGQDPALMAGEVHALGIWFGGGAAVLGFIYWFFVHRHMK